MRSMSEERMRAAQSRPSNVGPGPSRLAFKAARAWKKVWVRQLVLGAVPLAIVVGLGVRLAADPAVHAWVAAQKDAVIARLSERPEFAIKAVHVTGASSDVTREVTEVAAITPGMSSLRLKLADLQPLIEAIGPVKAAHVTLSSDGVLNIHVTERVPAALWRDGADHLWLVDREGALISRAVTRRGYPDLP
ncbi:MAG: cell division protein FtsQ/DivIB, partial [Paracoccaceae bacterium]